MSPPRGLSRDERRERVLLAADALLRSRSIDWGRLFTYDDLSSESGIDRKQIADDFGSKAQIVNALVEFYLDPDRNVDDRVSGLTEYRDAIFNDDSLEFSEGIRVLGMLGHAHARREERLSGRLALWSLARADPAVSTRLQQLYQRYADEYRGFIQATEAWFEKKGVKTKTGITTDQFITILNAVTEGLAIRADVDQDAVPEQLPGDAIVLLAESYFTDIDDDPIGSRLDAWAKG